jgi:hypothetical protein
MQSLGTPPDILPAAIRYARALLSVMPSAFVAYTSLSLSTGTGTGDAPSQIWSLLAVTLVGAVSKPLLVAGTTLSADSVVVPRGVTLD